MPDNKDYMVVFDLYDSSILRIFSQTHSSGRAYVNRGYLAAMKKQIDRVGYSVISLDVDNGTLFTLNEAEIVLEDFIKNPVYSADTTKRIVRVA